MGSASRARRGHLFYVHATDRGEHHHGPAPIAVERDPEVELARDVGGSLYIHLLDAQSFYVHAQDRRRSALRFLGRFRHLDAAGLAASARVHLRLHGDWRGDGLRCGLRFFWRRGETTVRNGDARAREDLLRLVFVDLHGVPNIAPPMVSAFRTWPLRVRPFCRRVREDRDSRSGRAG